MYFSKKFIIYENCIVEKNGNSKFKINKELYNDLKKIRNDNFELSEEGFLFEKGILVNKENEYDPFVVKSKLNNDFRLFIQVTNICNLHCKHCYANSNSNYRQYFNEEQLLKIVKEAYDCGISRIDFTGGEVFTQSFFIDFLKKLDNFPVSYSIFTNLTLLSDADIIKLCNLEGLDRIISSIDYIDPKKHDDFRGKKGCFERTFNNILAINKMGKKIIVNTIVNENNHSDIEKLVEVLDNYKIEVHLDTIVECGRAKTYRCIGNIENNIEFIKNLLIKRNCSLNANRVTKNICGVGKNLIFLDYQGDYNLCTGLNKELDNKYYLGRNLRDAIPKLSNFDLKCTNKECKFSSNDSCGCRHRAYENTGFDNSPDEPVCLFIKGLI